MNLAPGLVVPTPTLPLSFTRIAGSVGFIPSCNMLSVGAPSVPITINLAPGLVVPIPTRPLSFARIVGFIPDVESGNIFSVGAPGLPTTISLAPGVVVPIPTFCALKVVPVRNKEIRIIDKISFSVLIVFVE